MIMEIPTIETPRLKLRALGPSDFEPLYAIVTDRAVIRYFPRTEPWPRETVQSLIEGQQNHWDKHGFGWYAVECRQCNVLLGWCGLGVLDETGETEIKYLLKQSHWGRGLATEGASRCLSDGFRDYDLEMVIGLVHPENVASQRVLEKIGLGFSNRASYFGLELLRYTIDKERFREVSQG
jgi:RimJ/RimL family protein N-acetyltransferase